MKGMNRWVFIEKKYSVHSYQDYDIETKHHGEQFILSLKPFNVNTMKQLNAFDQFYEFVQ